MKKILILLFVWNIANVSFAQENWVFSPSVGINLIPIDEGGISGVNFKSGISLGFTASQLIEDNWSFNYGLSFNQRYAAYSSSSESDELYDLLGIGNIPFLGDFTVYENTYGLSTFWTMDIPVTATYKFNSGMFLYGGGYLNFLLSTNNEEETVTHIPIFEVIDPNDLPIDPTLLPVLPKNETTTSSDKSKSEMETLGYGVLVGFGYQSEKWILKFGYQHGLSDIRKDKSAINIPEQRAVTVSIGYIFTDLFATSKDKAKYDLELIE